jgi:hypothetical protein
MSNARINEAETKKNRERCAKILALSPKIRYVGMLNSFGKALAGQLRSGVRPYFRPEEARNEFFITAIRESLRKPFAPSLGESHFTLTVHDKVRLVSFSSSDLTIYITFEGDTPYDEIVRVVEQASKM